MNFKKLQDDVAKVEKLITNKSKDKDNIFVLLTHLLSECGEAADEIKGLEGKRAENPSNYSKEELAKELVDIVFNILRIASLYQINLDEHWEKRLKEIEDKFNL